MSATSHLRYPANGLYMIAKIQAAETRIQTLRTIPMRSTFESVSVQQELNAVAGSVDYVKGWINYALYGNCFQGDNFKNVQGHSEKVAKETRQWMIRKLTTPTVSNNVSPANSSSSCIQLQNDWTSYSGSTFLPHRCLALSLAAAGTGLCSMMPCGRCHICRPRPSRRTCWQRQQCSQRSRGNAGDWWQKVPS